MLVLIPARTKGARDLREKIYAVGVSKEDDDSNDDDKECHSCYHTLEDGVPS